MIMEERVTTDGRKLSQYWLSLLLLAMLYLPNGAALAVTGPVHSHSLYGVTFALFTFLACCLPMALLPRPRTFFLVMAPFALAALPYAYAIYFFRSIPGPPFFISVLRTTPSEAYEVLSVVGWIAVLPLLYAAAYIGGALRISRGLMLTSRQRKGLLAVSVVYIFLGLMTRQVLAYHIDPPPLLEEAMLDGSYPAGMVIGVARAAVAIQPAAAPRPRIGAYIPHDERKPEIVVLVIGESARADHLGINGYVRNTTPRLAALGAELITYKDVSAYAGSTYESVPRLMTGSNDPNIAAAAQAPSLVQAFQEAGFTAVWISNQESDIFKAGADIEEFTSKENFWAKRFRLDEAMLPKIDAALKQGGDRIFLVVHTYGSHIDYDDRYTARFKVFTPTFNDVKSRLRGLAAKDALINSYDNSLLATDDFLARLIEKVKDTGRMATVLYTSDHGENLYDDARGLFMHALPTPTRYDTHVPLLVWVSEGYKLARPEKAAALRRNATRRISHSNVFPTMLDMANIRYPRDDRRLSLASLDYEERPRVVYAGTAALEYDALD